MPLHCTAMGKVFLAHLSPTARASALDSLDLKPFTPHTITALPALYRELEAIPRQGFGVDNEEYALGVRCLAAPIYNHQDQVIAGVSVTALATRFSSGRDAEVGAALKQACENISHTLGFQGFPLPLDILSLSGSERIIQHWRCHGSGGVAPLDARAGSPTSGAVTDAWPQCRCRTR